MQDGRIIRRFRNGTIDLGEIHSLFIRLISHQPAVLFSQNKPAINNQPTIFFSHNKSAPAISHQPNEQAVSWPQRYTGHTYW
jgi:hypothetical protein